MKNELQHHTKRDKIKWAITGLMFFLAFVMIVGLILQVFGTGKTKPSEWFKKSEQEETATIDTLGAESAEGAVADINTRRMCSASAYSVSADESDTVSAQADTVIPAYSIKVYVDFDNEITTLFLAKDGVEDVTDTWAPYISVNDFVKREEVKSKIRVLYLPAGSYNGLTVSTTGFYLFVPSCYVSVTKTYLSCEVVTNCFSSTSVYNEYTRESLWTNTRSEFSAFYIANNRLVNLSGFMTNVKIEPNIQVNYKVDHLRVDANSGLSVAEKEGYTFQSWCVDEELTQRLGFEFSFENLYLDTPLYPKYMELHSLVFDSNGGSPISTRYVDNNQTLGYNPVSRCDGYTFVGWSVKDVSSGNFPFLGDISNYKITYTRVFKANWKRTEIPLPDDPVKEGHTFVGWYYDEAFTQPYDGEPIYSDTQLYAKFEIHKFTVTFNSDGGNSVANQTVNWNSAATLTTPTREKYAFKGWFLPNGTQYMNQPIKENITLTAHWERNVFNISFNTNGGTAVENTEVNLNTSISLPTTTKTGYDFKGWFLSDGTEYTNQPVTDDMALTAHWEIQTFTVTFYVDGEVYATKTVEYGQPLKKVAETANLRMFSVRMASGAPTTDENGAVIVTEDCAVEAQEMSDADKAINTVKNNKWAIIGGVVGGIALIAIIAAVCGGAKRKRRH